MGLDIRTPFFPVASKDQASEMGEDRLTANLLEGPSKILIRCTLKEIETGGVANMSG
jgi:hypothetical protein